MQITTDPLEQLTTAQLLDLHEAIRRIFDECPDFDFVDVVTRSGTDEGGLLVYGPGDKQIAYWMPSFHGQGGFDALVDVIDDVVRKGMGN